jgi:hypothetical protein
MTTYYNLDSLNASTTTSIVDVFTSVNNNSGGSFSVLLLLTVFFGYYFLFKKEDTITDLLASAFLTNVLSTLFLLIGWLAWPMYLTGLFMFIALFILHFIIK